MKVIILAGGSGRRLAIDGESLPKPLIPIGGRPMLWHIMGIFACQGFNDFILCLGYKADAITGAVMEFEEIKNGAWNVEPVDTGLGSSKLERLRRIFNRLPEGANIICYADNLCDINLPELIKHHSDSGKMFTITGVRPTSPYGHIFNDDGRLKFKEKPVMKNSLINAGFMVFEKSFIDYVLSMEGELETDVISSLADEGKLNVHRHSGGWNGVNNLKEYDEVCDIYEKGNAFWEIWKK